MLGVQPRSLEDPKSLTPSEPLSANPERKWRKAPLNIAIYEMPGDHPDHRLRGAQESLACVLLFGFGRFGGVSI